MPLTTAPLVVRIDDDSSVSGLLTVADSPSAAFVFAHGAGAGMNHSFMRAFAERLAEEGVAVVRYQFPFVERNSRRPDTPPVARATVRAAVAEARRCLPGLPLFAGGKSFGGRMSSQAEAEAHLDGVRGLAFVGFPLHPAGKPGTARADHLTGVACPMLFLQGDRDELAELALLRGVVDTLGARATLRVFDGADHSFHVRASSGTTDAAVLEALVLRTVEWMRGADY